MKTKKKVKLDNIGFVAVHPPTSHFLTTLVLVRTTGICAEEVLEKAKDIYQFSPKDIIIYECRVVPVKKLNLTKNTKTKKKEKVKMFNCDLCGCTSQPKEPLNLVIVETIPKTYVNMKKMGNHIEECITNGWEIVRQLKACIKCFEGKGRSILESLPKKTKKNKESKTRKYEKD